MSKSLNNQIVELVRDIYETKNEIPLHAPRFNEREKELVLDTINSSFVSTVGRYVSVFEANLAEVTGSESAVAVVNGTSGMHAGLQACGVKAGDYVITQPLTFVATCNSIKYCNADPIFVDVDIDTMSLSPVKLQEWLSKNAQINEKNEAITKDDHRRISACVPMHTFGHPAKLEAIKKICDEWHIVLIEDAAESLGSFYQGKHTGTFGEYGILSFNGNKIITTGGGGALLCSKNNAEKVRHLTTTAKVTHAYEFVHDQVGYNYRMPNINAAVGVAQLEKLETYVALKRKLAQKYIDFFNDTNITPIIEPYNCKSNYWLNGIIANNQIERDSILMHTNENKIYTRPIWKLMTELTMYKDSKRGDLRNSEWLEARVISLPSSVPNNI